MAQTYGYKGAAVPQVLGNCDSNIKTFQQFGIHVGIKDNMTNFSTYTYI